MMIAQKTPADDAMSVAFSANEQQVESIANGRLTWRPGAKLRGRQPRVGVTLSDDWLLFETSVPGGPNRALPSADRLGQWLRAHRGLPGGAKYCLSSMTPRKVGVRAECPVGQDAELPSRTQWACAGFERALDSFGQRATPPAGAASKEGSSNTAGQESDSVDERLATLVEQTAWPANQRSRRHFAIELETRETLAQAQLIQDDDDTVRLFFASDMSADVHTSPLTRLAVRVLLLTANDAVRMARAVELADESGYEWEVTWPQLPTAAELCHGLSALSTAHRLTYRELDALAHENVARTYLNARGWSL